MSVNIEQWKADRQRARTDLLFLCNEVLGYPDVSREVHGDLIDFVHRFAGGEDFVDEKGRHLGYRPFVPMWEQPGPRKRLVLAPRGSLKTTTQTIAHAAQWILNYTDVRILLSTAIGDQAEAMLLELKGNFQFNERFRFLFPEFCPAARKAGEFGNATEFRVPCRKRKNLKEPTVSVTSVGKVVSSFHYDVIKHSDVVDKENVRTQEGIRQVRDHYRYIGPLIERSPIPPHHGWEDVEGTRYDFGDLYGTEIIDKQEGQPPEKHEFKVFIKAAINAKGESYWPTRWPLSELKKEEEKLGIVLYSAQYMNNPVPETGGLAAAKELVWFPRKIVGQFPLHYHHTIDLHGMENNNDNDFTVLTTCGFDRDGRMYVVNIWRGRFTPLETIDFIFDLYKKYGPSAEFKIEKDSHARVLLPFLARERAKRQSFPMIVPMPRDNRISKKQRIRSLQSWFKTGSIRFCEDLACKMELIHEITKFDRYPHDDILDTLADQTFNAEGGMNYDVIPDDPFKPKFGEQFRGFHPDSHEPIWNREEMEEVAVSCDPRTGL